MANGRSSLDKEGCEFGRQLKKDSEYLWEDVKEIKLALKELIEKVDKIAQQVDRANVFTVIGTAVVGSIAGFISSRLGGN